MALKRAGVVGPAAVLVGAVTLRVYAPFRLLTGGPELTRSRCSQLHPRSPSHDGVAGAFALAAVLHQQLAYLQYTGIDIARYVDPTFGHIRNGEGAGPGSPAFPGGTALLDPQTRNEVAAYYGRVSPPSGASARVLHDYGSWRYAIPAEGLLAASGAPGGYTLGRSMLRHRASKAASVPG